MKYSLYCRKFCRIASLAGICSSLVMAQSGNLGCMFGPYTFCTNPVPATYLSGSWIEDDAASEWQITANDGEPMTFSQVSGWTAGFTPPSSIIVFPIVSGCPSVFYTVDASASSYTPSAISTGTEGSTNFQWKAINPTPSGACGGYQPVAWQQFNGTIPNKGNDTGTGTWKTSSNLSGTLSVETNLVQVPTSENLAVVGTTGFGSGTAQTVLSVQQTLVDSHTYDPADPHNIRFQGRQVYETANGAPTDDCYDRAANLGKLYPGGRTKILGSVWNVGVSQGAGNQYGPDNLGWTTGGVDWYRKSLPAQSFPCTATVPQAMNIVQNIPGFGNYQYATHTISFTINYPRGVVVKKDNITGTSPY